MTRESLRTTFGEDAELYDRVRPTYPPELFTDLAQVVGARRTAGARDDASWGRVKVLEIGPGTGQATAAMVDREWHVTAVELSPDLAQVLRRKFPTVEVLVADFDTCELRSADYDLVISATAFHWLDPETRVQRAADVLRPGGALAIVSTHHVAGGSEQFFADVQSCYDRFTDDPVPGGLPAADDVPDNSEELRRSGQFESVMCRRYVWDQEYSTAQYLELLSSYSGHRALTKSRRDGLYGCIGALIDTAGGSVTKRYLNQLSVGIS